MTETPAGGDDAPNADPDEPTAEQCVALLSHIQYEMYEIQTISAQPGSPLNSDDEFLKRFGTTMHQLVVNRLFSALDHLQLTVFSLQSNASPLIFAQYSLLRSALAGASTAHWAMSGDAIRRRERALKLGYYDLDQQVQFSRDVAKIPVREGIPNPKFAEAKRVIDSAPERIEAMHREYCALLRSRGKTKMSGPDKLGEIYETQIIEEMGRTLRGLRIIPNETELVVQYRLMSGFVHNCIWATYTGARVRTYQSNNSPMVEITANPVNIFRAAGTALNAVRTAKRRLVELAAHT